MQGSDDDSGGGAAIDDTDDSGGGAAIDDTDEGFWKLDLEDVESEPHESLEPGRPDPENVFFVLLGVALAVAFLWSAL